MLNFDENGCKLKFHSHVNTVCQKIKAFTHLNTYISRDQAQSVHATEVLSDFNYCPLIWMLYRKIVNDIHILHMELVYIGNRDNTLSRYKDGAVRFLCLKLHER